VTRQLCKWIPQSTELAEALQADDVVEGWVTPMDVIDADPIEPGGSAVARLAAQIGKPPGPAKPPTQAPPPDPAAEEATRQAAEDQKAKLAAAAKDKAKKPESEAAAPPSEMSQEEILWIAFKDAAESSGLAGQQASDAWARFVKLTVGVHPPDCTKIHWESMGNRMELDYNPMDYHVEDRT